MESTKGWSSWRPQERCFFTKARGLYLLRDPNVASVNLIFRILFSCFSYFWCAVFFKDDWKKVQVKKTFAGAFAWVVLSYLSQVASTDAIPIITIPIFFSNRWLDAMVESAENHPTVKRPWDGSPLLASKYYHLGRGGLTSLHLQRESKNLGIFY